MLRSRPLKFAYFHIPKSAGTCFTTSLASVRSVSPSFFANDEMSNKTAAGLEGSDIVAGHLSHDDYARHFPDRLAFTVLRDPVERCLSWYWYCRNVVPETVTAPDVLSAKALEHILPVGA